MLSTSFTKIFPKTLSARLIPSPHGELKSAFENQKSQSRSYGLISSDFDHALFVALDEATKASPIEIIYAKSFYTGLTRTQDPLTGEAMGMIAGADDEVIREGLKAAI